MDRARFPVARPRMRGAMLIVALLFLTLLTLLGVTFAALMKLERQAARNYVDMQTADFVLHSAVDAVGAQLRSSDNWYHYTHPRAPWLFMDPRRSGELGAGRYLIEELKDEDVHFSGILEPVKGVARSAYRAKVLDCASQINLNTGTDNLAMMLENLGLILRRSSEIGVNPFYADYPEKGNRVRGTDITRYRRKLEKARFTAKGQLAEIVGERNFEILSDFVTVHSWVDPNTGKSQDMIEIVQRLENQGSGSVGATNVQTGFQYEDAGHSQIFGSKSVVAEPRSPVNINTASREVVATLFAGLACRRAFPYIERQSERIGQRERQAGYAPESNDRFPNAAVPSQGGSEETAYTVRPVWVYTPRIQLDQAWRIANVLVQERRQRPFVCWESGRRDTGGFAEFVNTRIGQILLPQPQRCLVIDPLVPRNNRFQAIVGGGGGNPAFQYLWNRPTDPAERGDRRRRGMAVNEKNDWYYDTFRSGIMANFNPNARLNRSGHNVGACLSVDKTALVSPWLPDLQAGRQPSRSEVYCAYTTEACFDSNGYYEVIALAELDERYDPSQGLAQPKVFRKARAVIKIFDVVRHTTQFDFERQFRSGAYSSKRGSRSGRENVMTWPNPVIAATDYITSGSKTDGSIALIGQLDAMRLRLQPTARDQYFIPMQNVDFYHGFMFRHAREEADFLRYARRGWATGQVALEADVQSGGSVTRFDQLFSSVLDAEFSRQGRDFCERYLDWPNRHGKNQVLRGGGEDDGGTVLRVLQWPRLSQASLEDGNLRPDGLHTNLFNSPTRGSGIAMYPASKLMKGQTWYEGQYGTFPAEGKSGNVQYYNGGIAFWIRFDFNANDPIFCGLVGCTQVAREVGKTLQSSEGNQFYIFKSSFGELRIVRMYYHRAFGVPSMHGSNQLLPEPEDKEGEGGGGGAGKDGKEEKVQPDPNKAFARSEALVDISGWKAHEWHHVAVSWNDLQHDEKRIRVYVDCQPADSVTGVSYGLLGEEDFVDLNTKVPYDELTIGGIIRRQADQGTGLFKFSYNLRSSKSSTGGGGGSADGGVGGIGTFVLQQLKAFPANATIDEFFSFSGPLEGYFSTVVGRIKGYFAQQPGRYHNVFEITFPHGVEAIRMRSFDWTEYQPPFFHGPRGGVIPLQEEPVRATVYLRGTQRVFPQPPWLERSGVTRNRIGGVILRAPTGKGFANEPVEVVYRLDLTPIRGRGGQYGGLPVATPTVDDVTLTYFLPSTQILLWEDIPVNYDALAGNRHKGRTLGEGQR